MIQTLETQRKPKFDVENYFTHLLLCSC
uniref:Uncharacterized protein n=1 Tax=Heterorhabditis bacteriophora TaxID=37862 RepID=A0A1I7WRG7_HETBA